MRIKGWREKTNKQTIKRFQPEAFSFAPAIENINSKSIVRTTLKEDQFYFVEIYLNRSFNSRYNCAEALSKKNKKQKTKNTHTFPFEAITERYSTDKKEEGKLFILSILISWHGLR